MTSAPVLELTGVSRVFDGRTVLTGIDLVVHPGDRWVVLGPNGSGKTTLVQIASLYLHPTTGSVRVLGHELGRTDVRHLRSRVGVASPALTSQLRPQLRALDIVVTARYGALEPWWHRYDATDYDRALELLDLVGCRSLAEQAMGHLSSGERQRVLLARSLMADPAFLVLDEPGASLDLAGREELVRALTDVAGVTSPPSLLVTHHVEEIPENVTHVLLLRDGAILRAGPVEDTLSAEALSSCFGLDLHLERRHGRWRAWVLG